MKFGFKKDKESKTIKEFKIEGSFIVIVYLDGSQTTMLDTKENQKQVIDLMIKQALERDESYSLDKLNDEENDARKNLCLSIIYTSLLLALHHELGENSQKAVLCLSAVVAGTIVYNAIEYYKTSKRIDELKKYHVYLNMIKESDHESVREQSGLYINNLDEHSLDEVVRIRRKTN